MSNKGRSILAALAPQVASISGPQDDGPLDPGPSEIEKGLGNEFLKAVHSHDLEGMLAAHKALTLHHTTARPEFNADEEITDEMPG